MKTSSLQSILRKTNVYPSSEVPIYTKHWPNPRTSHCKLLTQRSPTKHPDCDYFRQRKRHTITSIQLLLYSKCWVVLKRDLAIYIKSQLSTCVGVRCHWEILWFKNNLEICMVNHYISSLMVFFTVNVWNKIEK